MADIVETVTEKAAGDPVAATRLQRTLKRALYMSTVSFGSIGIAWPDSPNGYPVPFHFS